MIKKSKSFLAAVDFPVNVEVFNPILIDMKHTYVGIGARYIPFLKPSQMLNLSSYNM